MKKVKVIINLILISGLLLYKPILAQRIVNERIIRKVADRILDETSYEFINTKTGEKYKSLKNVKITPEVKVESKYNDWHYTNGVLHIAMIELSKTLNEKKYKEFVEKNFEFVFKNVKYFDPLYKKTLREDGDKWLKVRSINWHMFFRMIRLDDYGTMAASLLEVPDCMNNKNYRVYIQKAIDHLMNVETRLDDRTISRLWPHEKTVWADDLYMSVSLLARAGYYLDNNKYFDEAINQVISFDNYLWDDVKKLYYHCYYTDTKTNGVAHWARANGWIMMAITDLLTYLPENNPQRDKVIRIFNKQAEGIARYQSETGLWHQLLDKEDSYLETSASCMFIFCLARGVNKGWLIEDFAYVAEMGWRGVLSKVDEDGNIHDICVGTGIMPSLVFYYKRPTQVNIPMGEGPFLRAGAEILKMKRYRPEPARTKYNKIIKEAGVAK